MLLFVCFNSPLDVMAHFYDVRVAFYSKRKAHLLEKLTEEWEKLDNKVENSRIEYTYSKG
jgi:hypothetical protein